MHDATHRLYRTARWQAVRQRVLADSPLCTYCSSAGRTVPASVVDHVTPHRGNVDLFWSGPFQSLCKVCHDGAKQREDNKGRAIGVTPDGTPLDRSHHWNMV